MGQIILFNFDDADETLTNEKNKQESVKFCSYYVMQKFKMELNQYIGQFSGKLKIQRILQVSI